MTLVISAPTRLAAEGLLDVIANERLSLLLEFTVDDARVHGRYWPETPVRDATVRWTAQVVVVLKAKSAEIARRDVERVCRHDVASSYRYLRFGGAVEIDDQEHLSPMCRRLVVDATGILVDQLRQDLADLEGGVPFSKTWFLPLALPPRFAQAYDIAFLERWIGTVETVGLKLLQFPRTYLACTAEELAAHALLESSRNALELFELGEATESAELMRQLEEELETVGDLAFEDHDILMAFQDEPCPADDPQIAEYMGIVNFKPEEWFTPFRPEPEA